MYHQKTKNYLKELAVRIREYKNRRKLDNRGELALYTIENIIEKDKYEYRHTHIAYCELKGRKREEIEKPYDYNQANEKYISQIKEKIEREYAEEQALCNCA